MAERVCDKCGKKKPLNGGKTCESGHFICSTCVDRTVFSTSGMTTCPICKKKLR